MSKPLAQKVAQTSAPVLVALENVVINSHSRIFYSVGGGGTGGLTGKAVQPCVLLGSVVCAFTMSCIFPV